MPTRRVVLSKGMIAVRARASPVEGGDLASDSRAQVEAEALGTGVELSEARPAPVRVQELKLLQRRAFERGREVERQETRDALGCAAQELNQATAQLQSARASDREELQTFAVRLACVIAEELTGSLVERNLHDARAMVRRVLDEILPELGGDEAVLEAHPEDLSLVAPHLAAGGAPTSVRLVPDPRLTRGSFRLRGAGMEFYSGLSERLNAIRERLLEGTGAGVAAAGEFRKREP